MIIQRGVVERPAELRSTLQRSDPPSELGRRDALLVVAVAVVAFLVRSVPVLRGGGLYGLLQYDDGVYFSASSALVHGLLPYRDFLLLQPPGILIGLAPFAVLGTVIGEPTAFAIARLGVMLLGAANAVLITLLAGRLSRLAGLMAGLVYAVWISAAFGERSTDFHGPQTFLLLLGLLTLARSGPLGPRRAAAAGALLGLATSIQLWQAVSVAVMLVWVVRSAGPDRRARLATAAAFLGAAAVAFAIVCLPFLVTAPDTMVRYVLLDQVGRPDQRVGLVDRLRIIEGLSWYEQLNPVLYRLFHPRLVVAGVGAAAAALIAVTAWRRPSTRLWASLAIAQAAVILVTPSFHEDYPTFMAPAAALVIGTGLADLVARPRAGRVRLAVAAPLGVALVGCGLLSVAWLSGRALPLAALEQDLGSARCVATDNPGVLVLTSGLRRNLDGGCQLVLDTGGVHLDVVRGRRGPGGARIPMAQLPEYQAAMVAWYAGSDVAIFLQLARDGLAPSTWAEIERRLPLERRYDGVLVRLAPGS